MAGEATNNPQENVPPATDSERKQGIDKIAAQITDTGKREIVKGYLEGTLTPEQRANLVHEKSKSEIAKMKQQIDSLNRRNASAEEFVQEIIKTMQTDVRERDMNEGYRDAAGEHPGYLEQFFKMAGTDIHGKGSLSPLEQKYQPNSTNDKHIDWDDRATFDHCLDTVKTAIATIPTGAKRELCHQYAAEFITAFVNTVADFDHFYKNFSFNQIPEMETKFAANFPYLKNFETWATTHKGMKPEDALTDYSKLDSKAIVEVKAKLEEDKKKLGAYPKVQQDSFGGQIREIEGLALNNPAEARQKLEALEKEMADEDKKLNPQVAAGGEQPAAAGQENSAEEAPGMQDQVVMSTPELQTIAKNLGKIPMIGGFILSMFLAPKTIRALGITAPTSLADFFKANHSPKTPEQEEAAKKKVEAILKDQFKIEGLSEIEILSKTSVKDFLKQKPPKFDDQKKYDALKTALNKNGAEATETEEKNVFDFIILKADQWKKPE